MNAQELLRAGGIEGRGSEDVIRTVIKQKVGVDRGRGGGGGSTWRSACCDVRTGGAGAVGTRAVVEGEAEVIIPALFRRRSCEETRREETVGWPGNEEVGREI